MEPCRSNSLQYFSWSSCDRVSWIVHLYIVIFTYKLIRTLNAFFLNIYHNHIISFDLEVWYLPHVLPFLFYYRQNYTDVGFYSYVDDIFALSADIEAGLSTMSVDEQNAIIHPFRIFVLRFPTSQPPSTPSSSKGMEPTKSDGSSGINGLLVCLYRLRHLAQTWSTYYYLKNVLKY